MEFPYPVLVGDVGGTNVRFAVVTEPGGPLTPLAPCRTAEHPGLAEAAASTLGQLKVQSALICAAGPAEGRRIRLTNASWVIDGQAVAERLGLSQGVLFNDFEALALSLPNVKPDWTLPVGQPLEGGAGPMLVNGPGTGLGTAVLMRVDGRWRAVASESGHSDFAPVTEEEHRYWPFVEPHLGRVTPETLVSGPGLRRLHRARLASLGLSRPEIADAEIVKRALAELEGEEATTVRAFWRLAARFAGDMAMTFVATGGVTLAGGILPRIVPLLDPVEFRTIFENKAPYDWLARRIPVRVLMASDVVLAGLAAIAADPQAYAIDFTARAWK